MHIRLITVVAEYTKVLPQMLAHYRAMGVDEILVHARTALDRPEEMDRIVEAVSRVDGKVVSRTYGAWGLTFNAAFFTTSRMEHPNDWFLLADPDEFQLYGQDFREILNFCEKKGYEHVEGCFVDRVAESGRIAEVDEVKSLWDQFPLGGLVSAPICGAVGTKIVAAKGRASVSGGQHYAAGRKGCPVTDFYVQVHHFKWIDDILERLRKRASPSSGNDGRYAQECMRFVTHYEKEGRIQIERPELMMTRCDPMYPEWAKVTKMREAAAYFSPWII